MLGAYLPIAHRFSPQGRSAAAFSSVELPRWPELNEGCVARLEAVRCRVLRKICQHFRGPSGDGWTDRQVRLECDVPRLEVVLAQSTLLIAARTAGNAPDPLRALLQVEARQDG